MYTKSTYAVAEGRYAGEMLVSDRSGRHWAIKDLSLCQRNIKEFKIEDTISMYYAGKRAAYKCLIIWRDNTVSRIFIPRDVTRMVINSIKHNIEPY